MKHLRSVETVRVALLAALGLSSFSCGGQMTAPSSQGGSNNSPTPNTNQTDATAPPSPTDSPTGLAQPESGSPTPESGPSPESGSPSQEGSSPTVVPPSDAASRFPCVNPTPLIVAGKDTGYDTCQGGTLRRRAVVDCPVLLPRISKGACPPPDSGISAVPNDACHTDSDCTKQPYGLCDEQGQPGCGCSYGCVRDSDCPTGDICVCADPIGRCEPATCNAGTCAAGFECAEYPVEPYCGGNAFACQTVDDMCLSASDCPSSLCDSGGTCGRGYNCTIVNAGPSGFSTPSSGPRTCSTMICQVGRPFLVGEESRLPSVCARADWRTNDVGAAVHCVPSQTRARLASAWLAVARMEHASIAAFARFALQLLAVGAPPELVIAAQRAMADETKHAQLAFGLASACADRDIGPGPLAVDACLSATDLSALVTTVFAEGCVGETVAAVEAREALEHTRDPAVRAFLTTIAEDETRHAELAWRTTAWAIAVGGQAVRDCLAKAMAEVTTRADDSHEEEGDTEENELLAHGIVGPSLRRRLRRAVLAEVVLPCARQLLDAPPNMSYRPGRTDRPDGVLGHA